MNPDDPPPHVVLPPLPVGLTQLTSARMFAQSGSFSIWVTGFFDMWQNMIRHFVTTANKYGFAATLREITHHHKAMRMIRGTSSSRFQMLVQTYAYLRYANYRKYYSEAVAVIRLEYQLEGVRMMAKQEGTSRRRHSSNIQRHCQMPLVSQQSAQWW